MLKHCRLIAVVFVLVASCFEAMAQTEDHKDVLLNGKPAKLNLVTGEVTYTNGEIATSRAAKKIKDSLLDTRTEIKMNLITDLPSDADTSRLVSEDSVKFTPSQNHDRVLSEVASKVEPTEDKVILTTFKEEKPNELVSNKPSKNLKKEKVVAYHTVSKGETLYSLSKRYNISVGKLLIANNLDTTTIKVGQQLNVGYVQQDMPSTVWTVSKGDTLFNIAERNNTTVDAIIDLNGLTSDVIKIGQQLQLNENSTITKK